MPSAASRYGRCCCPSWEVDLTARGLALTLLVGLALSACTEAPGPDAFQFRCGELLISLSYSEGSAVLQSNGERYALTQARAASGARYEGDGVEFWEHQGAAMLTINGERHPECQRFDP